jgi:hypothetical protein
MSEGIANKDELSAAAAQGPLPGHVSEQDDTSAATREDIKGAEDGVIPAPATDPVDRPVEDGSAPDGDETVGGINLSSGLTN